MAVGIIYWSMQFKPGFGDKIQWPVVVHTGSWQYGRAQTICPLQDVMGSSKTAQAFLSFFFLFLACLWVKFSLLHLSFALRCLARWHLIYTVWHEHWAGTFFFFREAVFALEHKLENGWSFDKWKKRWKCTWKYQSSTLNEGDQWCEVAFLTPPRVWTWPGARISSRSLWKHKKLSPQLLSHWGFCVIWTNKGTSSCCGGASFCDSLGR